MLFPDDNEEPVRRILVNADEACLFGNVVYVVSENEMLVCDLKNTGTFWTVIREDLRGEAREVQEYLQGTWEIMGIASRPYDALERKEAEAFLGTKLTYDWQNTAGEFAIEGVYNYSMPVLGFGRSVDNSANWPSEAGLMEGELQWQYVYLGEGEFFGVDLVRMDENRVWIYHRGTFFEAERVN